MNKSLLLSKKFRASVLAAISGVLTFLVTKLQLDWDVTEIMSLITVVMSPFLIYVGAEAISEKDAKAVIEQNKQESKNEEDPLS